MDKVFALLDLYKSFIGAQTRGDLHFRILNQTKNVIAYDRAILLVKSGRDVFPEGVSGNAVIDGEGPFAQAIKSLAPDFLTKAGHEVLVVSGDDILPLAAWGGAYVALAPLDHNSGKEEHWLWLERDHDFESPEINILKDIGEVAGHALRAQRGSGRLNIKDAAHGWRRYKKIIAAALILAFFLPVKLSATAPVEIVARSPRVVTAPFDGIIQKVDIHPGDKVSADAIVARMDREALAAEAETSEGNLRAAQAKLDRAARESLAAPEKKAELQALRAEIDTLQVSYNYTKGLLDKGEIRAGKEGVAVFSDVNAIEGRPVRTGDRLMMVADPAQVELLIRIPASSMLPFQKGDAVSFHLQADPLSRYETILSTMGYQASADADGLLTYKMRAKLPEGEDLRIGWQGTARVYSDWSVLGYAMLRRPLIYLRQVFGV